MRRLQLDCGECSLIVEIAVGLRRLQLDCEDCSWIAEIAFGLWRLQSPTRRWMTNCICKSRNFCSLIVEIAVGLWRLQLDCGDCSSIAEIAVGLWRLQSPTRSWMTNCICKLLNFCNLSNQTAISAIRLQFQQSDCNLSKILNHHNSLFFKM